MSYCCLNHDAALFCFEGELVAEVGVGDGNQLLGAFTQTVSPQVCNAVLGDDEVYIVLGGGDDGTGGEDGLDLGDGVILCGGGEGDEAFAALGLAGAADKVHLTACAAHALR